MSEYISTVIDLINVLNPFAGSSAEKAPHSPKIDTESVARAVRETLAELHILDEMPPTFWVRLAGLSGALAIGLGAYGAHGMKDRSREDKLIFETGNRYHMLNSLALLATSMSGRPKLTGTLLATGMFVFSGSCYYTGLTGRTNIRWITPYGGICLMLGWISFMF